MLRIGGREIYFRPERQAEYSRSNDSVGASQNKEQRGEEGWVNGTRGGTIRGDQVKSESN